MLENDSRSLASGGAGSIVVLLLSIPSLYATASHLLGRRKIPSKSGTYEDKDGVATEESVKAYSAKIPKTLLTIFTTAGFLISIASAVLGTLKNNDGMLIENWLNTAQWVSKHT